MEEIHKFEAFGYNGFLNHVVEIGAWERAQNCEYRVSQIVLFHVLRETPEVFMIKSGVHDQVCSEPRRRWHGISQSPCGSFQ